MNKLNLIILTIILCVSLPAQGYSASVLFDARVLNNFFWRVKEDINPHAQSEIEFLLKLSKDDKLGAGIIPFMSYSFDDKMGDEVDWYFYLTYKTEKLNFRGGYVYYYVMETGDQVRPEKGEVYSSVLYKGKLRKTACYTGVTAFFDVEKKGAVYTETVFSVDLGNSNSSKVFLNLGSIVGFDFGQFVEGKPQFTVMQLKASFNLRIAERVYLVPDYTYVIPLDPDKFMKTGIIGLSLSFR